MSADSLYSAGDCAAAGPIYERIGAAFEFDGEARYRAARCRFLGGDFDGAFPGAVEAIEAGFADEAGTSLRIAEAMARQGRAEEALTWLLSSRTTSEVAIP